MGRPSARLRDDILAHLRQAHPAVCRRWFEDIEPLDLSGGTLRLLVREPVQLTYLRKHCQPCFTEAAQAVVGMLVAVKFVGLDEATDAPPPPRLNGSPHDHAPTPTSWDAAGEMVLSPDYSFENFVVGPTNRLAQAGAVAVAAKPGEAYNPFFVHGGVGLGKTHLLHAICQDTLRRHPGFRIHYTSCNDFINAFHEAVQEGQMNGFRHRFRDVEALVIDDIHDLSHVERSQEEFFHTFNALTSAGKQVVLSSDAPPNEIPDLEERLSSRFNCGLVAAIGKPGYETRVRIVKSKAAVRGIRLSDEVAHFIAAQLDTNIRELEGAIVTLQALAASNGVPLDLDLAKQAVGSDLPSSEGRRPTIQEIVEVVCGHFGSKLSDILGKRRQRSIVVPRQLCMWIARKYTQHSLQEIGGYFGGRDHTTVIHAVDTINDKRREDAGLAHDLSVLERRVLELVRRQGAA